MAQRKTKIQGLKAEIRTLEEERIIIESLVQVGAAVRKRFLEIARSIILSDGVGAISRAC